MSTISNIPASLEWRVYKGDTANITIVIQDENGTDVDLTGYTFTGEIKAQPEDATFAQELDIIANGNVLSITIPSTSILPKVSYFDIQSVKDGTVWTIIKGSIYAEKDVTG